MKRFIYFFFSAMALLTAGCNKSLEVDAPLFYPNSVSVFKSDEVAATALSGLFAKMSGENLWKLSLYPAISADELHVASIGAADFQAFYRNALTSANIMTGAGSNFWSTLYSYIYIANAALEGLDASTSLTPAVRQQLTGEAKFARGFCYFYLVNLYGHVPYTTTTDYKINSVLSRTDSAEVWNNIIADLTEAESLLSADFLDAKVTAPTEERVRPTKWAAAALLSRCYLYTQDYMNAEVEATKIIDNTTFSLPLLNDVFLKNSMETVWQLQPTSFGANTLDAETFIIPSTGFGVDRPVYASDYLLNAFEAGDERRSSWINSRILSDGEFYYPYKYKQFERWQGVTEYTMVLRLAEQYLIRAEARIHQPGKIADGIADINEIRDRARATPSVAVPDPLPALAGNLSAEEAMDAVIHERQVELFTEWGHRWFDLKRTGRINSVMQSVTPEKGGTWNTDFQYYPLPLEDMQRNPHLEQNKGYN